MASRGNLGALITSQGPVRSQSTVLSGPLLTIIKTNLSVSSTKTKANIVINLEQPQHKSLKWNANKQRNNLRFKPYSPRSSSLQKSYSKKDTTSNMTTNLQEDLLMNEPKLVQREPSYEMESPVFTRINITPESPRFKTNPLSLENQVSKDIWSRVNADLITFRTEIMKEVREAIREMNKQFYDQMKQLQQWFTIENNKNVMSLNNDLLKPQGANMNSQTKVDELLKRVQTLEQRGIAKSTTPIPFSNKAHGKVLTEPFIYPNRIGL